MSKPGPLFSYGPEDKVLLPALPGVLLGDPFPLADPPPPLRLVVADSEGLCPWLVLGMDVAAARVIPSVTAGVNSPLDYVTPVSGGVADTQLISGSTSVSVISSSTRFHTGTVLGTGPLYAWKENSCVQPCPPAVFLPTAMLYLVP